jgi:hypothetical protein
LSDKCNAFLRPLKNKGFKEERVTRMKLDNLSRLILDSRVVEVRMVYTDDIPFHDP